MAKKGIAKKESNKLQELSRNAVARSSLLINELYLSDNTYPIDWTIGSILPQTISDINISNTDEGSRGNQALEFLRVSAEYERKKELYWLMSMKETTIKTLRALSDIEASIQPELDQKLQQFQKTGITMTEKEKTIFRKVHSAIQDLDFTGNPESIDWDLQIKALNNVTQAISDEEFKNLISNESNRIARRTAKEKLIASKKLTPINTIIENMNKYLNDPQNHSVQDLMDPLRAWGLSRHQIHKLMLSLIQVKRFILTYTNFVSEAKQIYELINKYIVNSDSNLKDLLGMLKDAFEKYNQPIRIKKNGEQNATDFKRYENAKEQIKVLKSQIEKALDELKKNNDIAAHRASLKSLNDKIQKTPNMDFHLNLSVEKIQEYARQIYTYIDQLLTEQAISEQIVNKWKDVSKLLFTNDESDSLVQRMKTHASNSITHVLDTFSYKIQTKNSNGGQQIQIAGEFLQPDRPSSFIYTINSSDTIKYLLLNNIQGLTGEQVFKQEIGSAVTKVMGENKNVTEAIIKNNLSPHQVTALASQAFTQAMQLVEKYNLTSDIENQLEPLLEKQILAMLDHPSFRKIFEGIEQHNLPTAAYQSALHKLGIDMAEEAIQSINSKDELKKILKEGSNWLVANGYYTSENISVTDLMINKIAAFLGGQSTNPTNDYLGGTLEIQISPKNQPALPPTQFKIHIEKNKLPNYKVDSTQWKTLTEQQITTIKNFNNSIDQFLEQQNDQHKNSKQLSQALDELTKITIDNLITTTTLQSFQINTALLQKQHKLEQDILTSAKKSLSNSNDLSADINQLEVLLKRWHLHGTVKGYINAEDHVFEGASFGANIQEQFKIFDFSMTKNDNYGFKSLPMWNSDFIEDFKWIIINNGMFNQLQTQADTLKKYLSIFLGQFMFNDAAINIQNTYNYMASKIIDSNDNDIHLYKLNIGTFPQSMFLQSLYNSLQQITEQPPELNIKQAFEVRFSERDWKSSSKNRTDLMTYEGNGDPVENLKEFQTWNEQQYNKAAGDYHAVKIELKFFAGFYTWLKEMQSNGFNIQ